MSDRVTLRSDGLTAAINPLGAELTSLCDTDGRELMTDADPAYWTGHAPILFPVIGMQQDMVTRIDGTPYRIGKHGFARERTFTVVERTGSHATFRLTDDAATRARYPFAFALDIGFVVTDAALAITATVTNPGDAPLPFSFGYHPAFAWPLPYGGAKADHRVIFERVEDEPIRRIDPPSGLVLPGTFPTPVTGDTLAPDPAMFVPDALIWEGVRGKAVTWGVPGRPRLHLTFPDAVNLGIWQKPHAHFLCIEPWNGIADPIGFTGDIRDKPGIMQLDAGEARSFRMTIALVDGDAAGR